MPQPNKPGVPWPDIQARYLAGESATSLAADYDVSRQAIMKRAKKEGWARANPQSGNPVAATAPVTLSTSISRSMSPKDRYGLRTAANARIAVDLAEQGVPVTAIAARCGMTTSAFKHWRDAEPDLERALQDAYSRHVERLAGTVNQAADRGDARAAQWMLERNPLSRDAFGNAKGDGDGTLRVIINVPRSAEQLQPFVLDGTVDAEPEKR